MAKKPVKKVVGGASGKSQKPGRNIYSKEGIRYNTNKLPWGVREVNGVARYFVSGKFATYSQWKPALNKHLAEQARERYYRRKSENDRLIAEARAAEEIALKKQQEEQRKLDEKEAKRLASIKPPKKTAAQVEQEKFDAWYQSAPEAAIHWPEKITDMSTYPPGVGGKAYSSGNSRDERSSSSGFTSELQRIKAALRKELSIVRQNTNIAENIYLKIIGDKAYVGIPRRFETYILKSQKFTDKLERFIKTTDWSSWSIDAKIIKKKSLEYSGTATGLTRELDILIANVDRIDETKNSQDSLEEEILREMDEIDRLTEEALDKLERRKSADMEANPRKFETEGEARRRMRRTMDSGFAAALGLSFDKESKFFRKLFSPYTNYREKKAEEKLKQKYRLEGISDQDIADDPMFAGVNPATVSTKDYSVKEKIKNNAKRLKREKEKDLRKKGPRNSTENTNNNSFSNSITNNNSHGGSDRTTNNNNSFSNSITNNNSHGGSSSSDENISNSNRSYDRSDVRSTSKISTINGDYIDLNRTDDEDQFIGEQKETNVILKKILRSFDNLRGVGGGGGGLLGGLLGGGTSVIPVGSLGKGAKLLGRGIASASKWIGRAAISPAGLTTAGIAGGGMLAYRAAQKDVEKAKQDKEFERKYEQRNRTYFSVMSRGASVYNPIGGNTSTKNSNTIVNQNKQVNPINAVDTNKVTNIYDNGKGADVDFSSHEMFMLKTFAPALAKAIVSASSNSTADTNGFTSMPRMKFW